MRGNQEGGGLRHRTVHIWQDGQHKRVLCGRRGVDERACRRSMEVALYCADRIGGHVCKDCTLGWKALRLSDEEARSFGFALPVDWPVRVEQYRDAA